MDIFVKNNISKREKLIIDVGHRFIKLMYVEYAGGEMRIKGSYKILAYSAYRMDGSIDPLALSKTVNDIVNVKKAVQNAAVLISLPSETVTYKIDNAKNIRLGELDKYITSNLGFARTSTETHNVDKTYLGRKELNGDSVYYYIAAALEKSFAAELVYDFKKFGLNIIGISFPMADIALLPVLFAGDSEPNKIYIDFGAETTKAVIETSGIISYIREFDIGYNYFVNRISEKCGMNKVDVAEKLPKINAENFGEEDSFLSAYEDCLTQWQSELARIINLMDDDGWHISKAVLLSPLLPGMDERMRMAEMKIADFWESITDGQPTVGKHTLRLMQQINGLSEFAGCIGGALSAYLPAMSLMSQGDKEAEAMRILKKSAKFTAIAITAATALAAGNIIVRTLILNKAQKDYNQYTYISSEIAELENSIEDGKNFIAEYETKTFPTIDFIRCVESYRPDDVVIISIDDLRSLEKEALDNEQGNEAAPSEEAPNEEAEEFRDLKGQEICVRGMGKNAESISKYVKNLMTLEFVEDAEIVGIEENLIADESINVFEVKLKLKEAV